MYKDSGYFFKTMIYQIDQNRIYLAAAKKVGFVLLLILGVLTLILFILSQNLNPGKSIMPILLPAIPKFIMIISFIVIVLFYRFYNYYKAMRFEVTSYHVAQLVSSDKLNVVNQIAAARNQSKYGSQHNHFIPISNITSIHISNQRIKIKSKNYNAWNGNGAVTIPAETEGFEELTAHFTQIKKQLTR